MRYDWLKSTTDARKQLYKVCKAIVDRHYLGDWRKLYIEVFGKNYATSYSDGDNFRAGRLGRKKSAALFDWIAIHHQDDANELLRLVLSINDNWDALFKDLPQTDAISLIRFNSLGLVTFANKSLDLLELKLKEEFIFKYEGMNDAFIFAFQCVDGAYHVMPLDERHTYCQSQKGGVFPMNADNQPMALFEAEQKGLHKFVFIIGDKSTIKAIDGLIEDKDTLSLPPYSKMKATLAGNKEQIQICKLKVNFC